MSRKILSVVLVPMLFIVGGAVHADGHAGGEIIKKTSPYSVSDTMNKFEAIVKKKGLGVFGRVNHRKNAQQVDMSMGEAEVLIFGNPKMGTALMQKDIAVALDLPLKVVVYQGADEKVYIAYRSPKSLGSDYDLAGHPALEKASGALDKLTSAAIQ